MFRRGDGDVHDSRRSLHPGVQLLRRNHAKPEGLDRDEPRRLAEVVAKLHLKQVVITSVTRDDLPDGGASIFVGVMEELTKRDAEVKVEFLIPDLRGDKKALASIIDSGVHVLGHNVETVPSLYQQVRKGSDYQRSLTLLEMAARQPGIEAKSALMLGLGESRQEVLTVLQDLREVGVHRLALGQYLRPTRYHLPVLQYLEPAEFDDYAEEARALGFSWVKAGPLVRSSYHAHD